MRFVFVLLLCSMTFCVVLAQSEEVLLENLAESEGFSSHDLEEMLQTRGSLNGGNKRRFGIEWFSDAVPSCLSLRLWKKVWSVLYVARGVAHTGVFARRRAVAGSVFYAGQRKNG